MSYALNYALAYEVTYVHYVFVHTKNHRSNSSMPLVLVLAIVLPRPLVLAMITSGIWYYVSLLCIIMIMIVDIRY